MSGPTTYSVAMTLKAPGADGFQPLQISTKKPDAQAFLVRCSAKLNGVDANISPGFIERFIDNLRQTRIFSNVVKATEMSSLEAQPHVELTLFTTEFNDTHQGEAAIMGCLAALTFGLLALVASLHSEFTSEMVLDVRRSDGMSKRYEAKSKGTLSYGLFSNRVLAGTALAGTVTTCNINSIMSQMIADSEFYSMQ